MARSLFLILLITLIVSALYLFSTSSEEPIALTTQTSPAQQDYDYFMTAVDSLHLNLAGERQYHLQAQRITHYPNPDFSDLNSPNIIIFHDSEPPWHITADNGKLSFEAESMQDKIELSNNVVIHKINQQGQPLDMYTEALVIYPDSKYIRTEREVLLVSPGSEVSSLGMTADLTIDEINFLAKVRGRYEQIFNN